MFVILCNIKVCNTTTSPSNDFYAPYFSKRGYAMSAQGARNLSPSSSLETFNEDLKAWWVIGIMFPSKG
jgi:hypothetical protein